MPSVSPSGATRRTRWFTDTMPAAPSMFWTVTAGFPGMKRPRWRVTARAVASTPPPGA